MDNIKHTPGPWLIQGNTVYALHTITSGTKEYQCNRFCAVVYVDQAQGVPTEEREANARLIAAAPDLLEALRGFRAAYYEWWKTQDNELLEQAFQDAQAALIKATGTNA